MIYYPAQRHELRRANEIRQSRRRTIRRAILYGLLAIELLIIVAVVSAKPAKAGSIGDTFCTFEVFEGTATHVGFAYYPWERTISLRQKWGDIRPDFQIEKRGHLAAFHHPDYLKSRDYMGRRAWVLSVETGRMLWFDMVDVMGAEDGIGTLGWEPGVNYEGRVTDHTPEGFGWLLGYPDGPRDRGGQDVIVLFPDCDDYQWPEYE